MSAIEMPKKINKLFRNPNLFFYDYFRKKVYDQIPEKTKVIIKKVQTPASPTIDISEIQSIGLLAYIQKCMKAGTGVEDGYDKNSLLMWSGYLRGLIQLLTNIKYSMSLNVTIYTLGGGFSTQISKEQDIDSKLLFAKLISKPDFVIELNNQLGEQEVIHFYLYDINDEGLAIIRSNRALIRKFPIDDLYSIYPQNGKTNNTIDAVYTWVNQADPIWQNLWIKSFPDDSFDPDRFTSNDELKFSLRSLNKYAPWLNNIYIVSNCTKPEWLKNNNKIVWIDHSSIFPNEKMLPTFNSHAIECCLHLIPGLSENFIYLNDDFILSQPCLPSDFFDETDRSLSYFEPYGMVNSNTSQKIEVDYLVAATNSSILLNQVHPYYNARNLHRHVPYCLKKSVLLEIEKKFPETITNTRMAKLRSPEDINLTSFLYHHFAMITGKATKADYSGMIVRPENIKPLLHKDAFKYKVLCFNDGNGSANDVEYKKQTLQFFSKRLNEPAPWE